LDGEEDAVAEALKRGGLSFSAQNALVLAIERHRLDILHHFDGDFSEDLILTKEDRRVMLENRARSRAIHGVRDESGALTETDRGFYETEFFKLDEGGEESDALARIVKGWADQLKVSLERTLYQWAAKVLAEKGAVSLEGEPLTYYLAVVHDPENDEVVGLAMGRFEDGNWLRLEGLLSNPRYHDLLQSEEYWSGVESEALVSFVRAATALNPDVKVGFEASSGRSYRVGVENNFLPENEPFDEEDLTVSHEDAAQILQNQRANSIRELAYTLDTLVAGLGPKGMTEELLKQHEGLSKLNADFQKQVTSKTPAIKQDVGVYYRLRQAMTDFVVALSDHVRAHPGRHLDHDHLEETRLLLELTAPHPDPVTLGIRYADTLGVSLIVQLEDEPVVEAAARSLYGKNPKESEWVRLDSDGRLRTVEGRVVSLDRGSRVILVGHGTPGRIAGLSAQNIIDALMNNQVFEETQEIRRISLVACSTDDPSTSVVEGAPEAPFARELLKGLHAVGVRVGSISSRTTLVSVDGGGRKWTGIPDADGRVVWSQKNSANKRIVQWGEHGEIVTSEVPVEQGLVRVLVGNAERALGRKRSGVIRFVNGRQVTESGEAVSSGDLLTPHELMLVKSLLGPVPHGLVRFDGGRITSAPKEVGLSGASALPEGTGTPSAVVDAPAFVSGALLKEVHALLGEATQGVVSPEELRDRYIDLTPNQQKQMVSMLLEDFGKDYESPILGALLEEFKAEVASYYLEGELSSRARHTVEVLLEQRRLDRMAGIAQDAEVSAGDLHLDPRVADLALETASSRPPSRLHVSPSGDIHRVEHGDAQYTTDVYALNRFGEEKGNGIRLISSALYREVASTIDRWSDLALEVDLEGNAFSHVYRSFNEVVIQRGVTDVDDRELATYVAVTRDPDGEVAAMGVFSRTDGAIVKNFTVTDARLRISPRPSGNYWVGAGYENIIATLRTIDMHFPDLPRVAETVNARSLRIDLDLYYSERGEALISLEGEAGYATARSSLAQRKQAVLVKTHGELEVYLRGLRRPNPARLQELSNIKTVLDGLSRSLSESVDAQAAIRIEGRQDTVRFRMAALSQKVRLEQGDRFYWGAYGNNILYLDQAHRPTSDPMALAYADMVGRIEPGILPRELAHLPGRMEDYQALFDAFVSLKETPGPHSGIRKSSALAAKALKGVTEQLRRGTLPTDVADALSLNLIRLRQSQREFTDALVGNLGRKTLSQLESSQSQAVASRWEMALYGDTVERETLRKTGTGESFEAQGASEVEIASSRLVTFNMGVQLDAFGLPVLPDSSEALSVSDQARVTQRFGTEFSGRVRISSDRLALEPVGDLFDENPAWEDSTDSSWVSIEDRFRALSRLDAEAFDPTQEELSTRTDVEEVTTLQNRARSRRMVGVPERLPESLSENALPLLERPDKNPIPMREDVPENIVLPDTELSMNARLTALDQEMVRLREVQSAAVERVITDYSDDHFVQVVLDPASLVREGDRIGLAVVRRADLDENERIPQEAERIPLEVEVPGLGEDYLDLFEKLTQASLHNTETPSVAGAALLGSARDEEAVTYTPENGTRPAVEPPEDSLSLVRAKESLLGRHLVKGAVAATAEIAQANNMDENWVPILATLEESDGRFRIQFINSQETSETRWIETTDDRLAKLKTFMDSQLSREEVNRVGVNEGLDPAAEAPDALNSAFMVQFIIGLAQDLQRQSVGENASGTLATALEVHRYVFGAQVAFGAVLDTVKIVKLV
ncbi:MAG: C80 family cysteine peptidase, partial [Desulfobacterales bacterium]|nr:C80 family cysteine peptidase [Desulfobacterales bacterium]